MERSSTCQSNNQRRPGSPVEDRPTAMNPRTLASYGALSGRGGNPGGATHRLRADNDTTFAEPAINSNDNRVLLQRVRQQASNASSSASWSWSPAGLITAAVAIAVSVTVVVYVVQLASYIGTAGESPDVKTTGVSIASPTTTAELEMRVRKVDPDEQPKSTEDVVKVESAAGNYEELSFAASNRYTQRGDSVGVGYTWLKGQILVEPSRTTTLKVITPVDAMFYWWEIIETNDKVSVFGEFVGESVDVVFGTAPMYTVVLLEKRADGTVSRNFETDVFCKYVRREIRSLFDDERNELFDAMKVLWDVTLEEGQALYGEAFLNILTIDKFHQIGASDIVCDHFHDGLGFGMSHSMVTLMFESSLQAVNPKLSVPYWDFTIEAYIVDTQHDGDYTKLAEASELWTPGWFGGSDSTDFQVKDGRWGFLSIPIVDPNEADILGADVFGRMRSPWNVNDRMYLARGLGEMCGISTTDYYGWPTCETHYMLQKVPTSYYGYTWISQFDPHGTVHIWIGGTLDCKKNMEVLASIFGSEDMTRITGTTFVHRKNLFRDGFFRCVGRAEEGMTSMEVMQSSMCGCLDLDMDKKEDYMTVYENISGAWGLASEGFTDEEKKVVATQYCTGVVSIGESSQSSSPIDPSFWSLHPTMERLLMFKRITGTMTDLSWPDEPGLWTGDDGTVYDVITSLQSDSCNGHRGSDVFPYGIAEDLMTPHFTFFGETGPNVYSNRELVHFFDPSVNVLTYIYDNFEWPHCLARGYDMNDLFTGAAAGSSASSEARAEFDYGLFRSGERHQPLYGKHGLNQRLNKRG